MPDVSKILVLASSCICLLASPVFAENARTTAGELILSAFKKESDEIVSVRRAEPASSAPVQTVPVRSLPSRTITEDAEALLQRRQGAFFGETTSTSPEFQSQFANASSPLTLAQAENIWGFRPNAGSLPASVTRLPFGVAQVSRFTPANNFGYGKMYTKQVGPDGRTVPGSFLKENTEY